MVNKILTTLAIILVTVMIYLLAWPVPIDPMAWEAPPNPGYTGVFASNSQLQGLEKLALGDHHAPEEVVLDDGGRLYAATENGWIVRQGQDPNRWEDWVDTGGRPLGIVFDKQGNLIVADAFRGLLQITPQGDLLELATEADGIPIRYANNVDVADDGKIYFSDSSTKFGAEMSGGTFAASVLDLLEHGGHGRLLVYDPEINRTTTLLDNLNFPNGVAISADQRYLLVAETGAYRILRYELSGQQAGQIKPILEELPGFPDNLTRGQQGRYWVAFIAPRNGLLDNLAGKPWMRKVIQRLPAFLRPQAVSYGHIIGISAEGDVLVNLQDPKGTYPLITSVTESNDYLYLGSLAESSVGRLAKSMIGL